MEEIDAILAKAVVDSLEKNFNTDHSLGIEPIESRLNVAKEDDIIIVIDFVGALEGNFVLCLNKEVAGKVASKLLEKEVTEISDDVLQSLSGLTSKLIESIQATTNEHSLQINIGSAKTMNSQELEEVKGKYLTAVKRGYTLESNEIHVMMMYKESQADAATDTPADEGEEAPSLKEELGSEDQKSDSAESTEEAPQEESGDKKILEEVEKEESEEEASSAEGGPVSGVEESSESEETETTSEPAPEEAPPTLVEETAEPTEEPQETTVEISEAVKKLDKVIQEFKSSREEQSE